MEHGFDDEQQEQRDETEQNDDQIESHAVHTSHSKVDTNGDLQMVRAAVLVNCVKSETN